MAALTRAFLDTNVLVAGMIDFGERSVAPLALMDAIATTRIRRPLTAWHCCLEFFSVTTRLPEEYRLGPDVALQFVQEEILDRFDVGVLPTDARSRFLGSAVTEGVTGGRIYDAHIANVARHMGAEVVVTDNRRHFTSLLRHGVRVLLSSEAVEALEAGEGSEEALDD